MQDSDSRATGSARSRHPIPSLLALSDNRRHWGFLVLAALSMGLPAFLGVWLDQFAASVIASMGGWVIHHQSLFRRLEQWMVDR